MTRLNMLFGALFRPKPTFARLAEGLRWVWAPALAVLVATSLANVAVSVPLQLEASRAWAEKQAAEAGPEKVAGRGGGVVIEKSGPSGPETSKEEAAKEEAAAKEKAAQGEDLVAPPAEVGDQERVLIMTSGLVFAVVGVFGSLMLAALFFFIAGKVWAKRVTFSTYVSMVALASMPIAARDILQTVYQSVTGTWVQHQGISSLVAVKDSFAQGGLAYGVLSQIDVWSIWMVALLYIGIQAAAGFEKKRAITAVGIFVVVTVAMRAVPAILTGAFGG